MGDSGRAETVAECAGGGRGCLRSRVPGGEARDRSEGARSLGVLLWCNKRRRCGRPQLVEGALRAMAADALTDARPALGTHAFHQTTSYPCTSAIRLSLTRSSATMGQHHVVGLDATASASLKLSLSTELRLLFHGIVQ
jgi:hypothetical protein